MTWWWVQCLVGAITLRHTVCVFATLGDQFVAYSSWIHMLSIPSADFWWAWQVVVTSCRTKWNYTDRLLYSLCRTHSSRGTICHVRHVSSSLLKPIDFQMGAQYVDIFQKKYQNSSMFFKKYIKKLIRIKHVQFISMQLRGHSMHITYKYFQIL